ncbi:putative glycosyltransferase [Naviculisporaceae sp. PSN 640]
MYAPFVSQRTLKTCLPGLAFLAFCLLLLATGKSLSGSGLPKPTFRGGAQKGLDRQENQQHPIPPHRTPAERPKLEPGRCTPEIEFLRRQELGLTDNIRYTRRCIKPVYSDTVDRDAVTNVSTPLVNTAKMATINLTSCVRTELPPCERLELHVPKPYPAKKYPHLLFGVSSRYERMQNSVDTFGQFLSGTGAQLYVIIEDADKQTSTDPTLTKLQQLYRDADIQATFKHTVDQLHFILVRSLLSFSQTQNKPGVTKWLGIIDDDTFITSLHALESRILSQFDPSKPYWLGALSDDFHSVNMWGFMAFGGAGVFLSLPLASQIEPHIETCMARSRVQSGDGILKECIYRYTRTKLTIVDGLYQHDLHGDASGFYESGVNPVTVHHWKSWYQDPIPKMAEISKVCGDCWLQRWKFRGINDMLLANGYSIAEGPGGLDKVDLSRIEGTWSHPTSQFDPSYGPLRRKLGPARKKSYKLVDVNMVAAGGELRQIYVHRKPDAWQAEEGVMDEVIELIWEV